jgi:Flp pilus assembly pilin Flp
MKEREHMKSLFQRCIREEDGQDLTEYALLLALIAVATVAAINGLAGAISPRFASATAAL